MNRAQRRAEAKRSDKPFKETLKSLEKDDGKPQDRTMEMWCWRHQTKWENEKHPTERDKKKAEEIRLKPFKKYDENGKLIMGRRCGKCGNEVLVSEKRAVLHTGLEGSTDKQTDEVKPNLDYGINI